MKMPNGAGMQSAQETVENLKESPDCGAELLAAGPGDYRRDGAPDHVIGPERGKMRVVVHVHGQRCPIVGRLAAGFVGTLIGAWAGPLRRRVSRPLGMGRTARLPV
jgi:hypothetical protein